MLCVKSIGRNKMDKMDTFYFSLLLFNVQEKNHWFCNCPSPTPSPTSFTMATDLHPFLLLLTLALLAKADWLDGNDGVDRPNGDLPGMPVALKNGSAPRDCAAMCRDSAECEAWAFLKQNCGGNTDRPQCFLKAAVTNQVKKTCLVSSSLHNPQQN